MLNSEFGIKKHLLLALPLAVASFLLNEIISVYSFGYIVSIIICISLIAISTISLNKAFFCYLLFVISSTSTPRGLEDIAEGLSYNFYTFNSTLLGGLTLSTITLFMISAVSILLMLIRKNSFVASRKEMFALCVFFVMFLITLMSTFVFSFERFDFNVKLSLSDLRIFIIIFSSYILIKSVLTTVSHREFLSQVSIVLILSGLLNGFEAVFCVLQDFILEEPKLTIGTQPYILVPVFFAMLYSVGKEFNVLKYAVLLVVFLGAFRFSRGEVIYTSILICMFIGLMVMCNDRSVDKIKNTSRMIAFFVLSVFLAVLLLTVVNERLWILLVWKFNFFSTELFSGNLSESPGIRVYEFYNIFNSDFYYLMFGKGFGGYFQFDNPPIPYRLGLSDYSPAQLDSGSIYKPHTFINYIALKHGLVGLIVYVFSSLYVFCLSASRFIRSRDKTSKFIALYCFASSLYILNMFWQPNLMLMFVVCLFVLGILKKKNEVG